MKRLKRGRAILGAWTLLVLAFLYLPLAPLVVYSFNDSRLNVVWQGFTLRWYRELWLNRPLMESTVNSLLIALLVTLLSTILGVLGAWSLYRYRFRLQSAIAVGLAMPLIVPEVLMGVSLLIFFAVARVPLGFTTIIIGHTTFCFPFVLLTVHARLLGMDPAMEEAAMDLGATPLGALRRIIIPYLLPSIVSGALMAFTLSMDELIVTYFLAGPGSTTLPMRIFGMARVGLSPVLDAVSTLFVLVTAVLLMAAAFVHHRAAATGRNA